MNFLRRTNIVLRTTILFNDNIILKKYIHFFCKKMSFFAKFSRIMSLSLVKIIHIKKFFNIKNIKINTWEGGKQC